MNEADSRQQLPITSGEVNKQVPSSDAMFTMIFHARCTVNQRASPLEWTVTALLQRTIVIQRISSGKVRLESGVI